MKPKEKAKELLDKMEKDFQYFASREIAIQHAVIAVDEILKSFGTLTNGNVFYTTFNAIEYYQEVKQEIINLLNQNRMNKSAVEWFSEQILKSRQLGFISKKKFDELFKEANKMFESQIIDAHFDGQCDETEGYPLDIAEKYFDKTFKSE
jgi:hypothetical protein